MATYREVILDAWQTIERAVEKAGLGDHSAVLVISCNDMKSGQWIISSSQPTAEENTKVSRSLRVAASIVDEGAFREVDGTP